MGIGYFYVLSPGEIERNHVVSCAGTGNSDHEQSAAAIAFNDDAQALGILDAGADGIVEEGWLCYGVGLVAAADWTPGEKPRRGRAADRVDGGGRPWPDSRQLPRSFWGCARTL